MNLEAKCRHTTGNMEVLRSVMFGLLTFSLIMSITALPVDQSQIWTQNISRLNDLLKQARTDANRTFWDNCLSITNICVVNPLAFDPPSFQVGNQSTGEMLQEMFNVCNNFTQLLDKFLSDITQQSVYPKLADDLKKLMDISLSSVEVFLQQLKPNLQKGSTTVDIDRSTDSTRRNSRNLQIAARMATEMDKMSKAFPYF